MSTPSPYATERVLVAAFSGWNDAGEAATSALGLLRRALGLEPYRRMTSEPYFDFQSARPIAVLDDDGETELVWPAPVLHGPPRGRPGRVYALVGPEPTRNWSAFSRELLDLARSQRIAHVLLVGSLVVDVPHTRAVPVRVHALDARVRREHGVVGSTYEGPVGIVTVIADAARGGDVDVLSAWGWVPSYVPDAPSPKVARALAARITELVGVDLPVGEFDGAVAAWEAAADRLLESDPEARADVEALERELDGEAPSPTGPAAGPVAAAPRPRGAGDAASA